MISSIMIPFWGGGEMFFQLMAQRPDSSRLSHGVIHAEFSIQIDNSTVHSMENVLFNKVHISEFRDGFSIDKKYFIFDMKRGNMAAC